MTFESFIKGDFLLFREGESLEEVILKLDDYKLHLINGSSKACAIHAGGAEFLFESNQLYLIQYEFGQVQEFSFEGKVVNEHTHVANFKSYLTNSNVGFVEESKYDQIILITTAKVHIYFDATTGEYLTAIISWY